MTDTLTRPRRRAGPRARHWVGERFGSWLVTDLWGYQQFASGNWSCLIVRCRCKCGTRVLVQTANLLTGRSKSCHACRDRRATR
jgi:hypothetical protein